MTTIAAYLLGLIILPAGGLALWLPYRLLHREAWYCPCCQEWAVHEKDDPTKARYLPAVAAWAAFRAHQASRRYREWL